MPLQALTPGALSIEARGHAARSEAADIPAAETLARVNAAQAADDANRVGQEWPAALESGLRVSEKPSRKSS
jgi:hypothetical protein